ncbi:hypothetical protein [Ruminococcus callidus]|jgi:hypothetical protein|uniref:hypothetical protein n=1 Tax=Ruminococcus callidus TaxID=40519 RepID=UPI0035220AD5
MAKNAALTELTDEKKVKNILRKIIIEEGKNISSKGISDWEMVKKIKKIIEEEVKCY